MNKKTIPDVLESVEAVVKNARYVSIDEQAVYNWAKSIADCQFANDKDDSLLFRGSQSDCANYALISDALNFCFWSDEPWEVEYKGKNWTRTFAMMAGLLKAIEKDSAWLTAARWIKADAEEVTRMFAGIGEIPMPQRRVEIFNETGRVLADRFDGHFLNLVEQELFDARRISYRLAECFPSFYDVSTFNDREVAFLKRAQICAADLHRVWVANGHSGLTNLESLTVFADYRLPQLFWHEKMIQLADDFATAIRNEEEIKADSIEEIELRAATIWVAKLICDNLTSLGRPVAAWELDYELWLRAKSPEVTVPHHRTITNFY